MKDRRGRSDLGADSVNAILNLVYARYPLPTHVRLSWIQLGKLSTHSSCLNLSGRSTTSFTVSVFMMGKDGQPDRIEIDGNRLFDAA